jgi:hypothetical protein
VAGLAALSNSQKVLFGSSPTFNLSSRCNANIRVALSRVQMWVHANSRGRLHWNGVGLLALFYDQCSLRLTNDRDDQKAGAGTQTTGSRFDLTRIDASLQIRDAAKRPILYAALILARQLPNRDLIPFALFSAPVELQEQNDARRHLSRTWPWRVWPHGPLRTSLQSVVRRP